MLIPRNHYYLLALFSLEVKKNGTTASMFICSHWFSQIFFVKEWIITVLNKPSCSFTPWPYAVFSTNQQFTNNYRTYKRSNDLHIFLRSYNGN